MRRGSGSPSWSTAPRELLGQVAGSSGSRPRPAPGARANGLRRVGCRPPWDGDRRELAASFPVLRPRRSAQRRAARNSRSPRQPHRAAGGGGGGRRSSSVRAPGARAMSSAARSATRVAPGRARGARPRRPARGHQARARLVPVQRALVPPPLEYGLTIRDSGTYAISISESPTVTRSISGPRPREEALSTPREGMVTLAELFAGVEKRMGHWIGPVKDNGRPRTRRRSAERSRAPDSSRRCGAGGRRPRPRYVFHAFAYAVHPSWTKGHASTVAQEIAGPQPLRWHVAVRDGSPSRSSGAHPPRRPTPSSP